MVNKKTRSFSYKASRDIISTIFSCIFIWLLFFIMKRVLLSEDTNLRWMLPYLKEPYIIGFIIAYAVLNFLDIYAKSSSMSLLIKEDEVVFYSGWLSKCTTSIPAHKIRSCSKSSGLLQRACDTMDITITTAGDAVEISFHNIERGEIAYDMLCELARKNGHE